eukprot:TRINITY_DN2395_c0_g1_i2.p1 TRINITY_DN2395_c0_g1~~TRINITY_DN2395_c0_g1_i2.p1  ORF type:complete len:305 (+),score=33.59 TRINITY_DN2395_c0_g1_i2:660-1574(+)
MSLQISLCTRCRSIVSHLLIPALWENYPDFIHRQFRHFRRCRNLTHNIEIQSNFQVIHRIVPDIVYQGIQYMILIKTQRDTLLAPLQSVSGIVERRHTLPILSNVLLEKKGDRLTLLATDIEIQITTSTECAGGEGDGAVTVGARKMQEILRSLPDTSEVSLVLEDKRLQVRAGKSRFSLQTLPADDFPRMTMSEGETKQFSISQRAFRQLISKTQYSMAAQDVRYYLNGLLLLVEGKELRAVATDGHRLAYASVEIDTDLPRQEMILPRKTVLELKKKKENNNKQKKKVQSQYQKKIMKRIRQ